MALVEEPDRCVTPSAQKPANLPCLVIVVDRETKDLSAAPANGGFGLATYRAHATLLQESPLKLARREPALLEVALERLSGTSSGVFGVLLGALVPERGHARSAVQAAMHCPCRLTPRTPAWPMLQNGNSSRTTSTIVASLTAPTAPRRETCLEFGQRRPAPPTPRATQLLPNRRALAAVEAQSPLV